MEFLVLVGWGGVSLLAIMQHLGVGMGWIGAMDPLGWRGEVAAKRRGRTLVDVSKKNSMSYRVSASSSLSL